MAIRRRIKTIASFCDGAFEVTVEDDGNGNFSIACESDSYHDVKSLESALNAALDYIVAKIGIKNV